MIVSSRLFLVLTLLISTALSAQELRDTLFVSADAAMAEARAADAPALSPRNFDKGIEEFEDAEEALRRGRNIDSIRERIARATLAFKNSTKAAELARISLAAVIKTRQDARNAEAVVLSKPIWEDAERSFSTAVRELEKGDLKDSKKAASEAESLYRDAELGAIKTRYLAETRQLLAEAEQARVGRYAPDTLAEARKYLQRAEKELNENRYDTDLPRSLAQQANYEARHANYLAGLVRNVSDKRMTVENLILAWEKPLVQIAGAADVVPDLAAGPAELSAKLATLVEDLIARNQSLDQDLNDSNTRVIEMEEEIRLLDEKLGGATQERRDLMQRLQQQARVKEQFDQVESMFDRDQAVVFREGNDVTIRLVGLSFASGSAAIDSNALSLLERVRQAVDVFPRSALLIEGHTDSYGGDETNLALSQNRAEAVMDHMIKSLRIPSTRLTAIGYGETRPVANNETKEGRARNRRIDIVIQPNLN